MSISTRTIKIALTLILILILCLAAAGCGVLPSAGGGTGGDGQYASQEQALDSGEEGALDEIDLSGASEDAGGDGGGDSGGEDSSGEPVDDILADFACPDTHTPVELWVDHDIKFKTPQWGTWDITADGGIVLSIAKGHTEDAITQPFPETRVSGVVDANWSRDGQKCSFSQDIDVITVADGTCDNGVLSLTIATNFTEVDTPATCCSADGDCDTNQMKWLLPAVSITGVEFSAANGLSATKEFSGGEGQFHWWLDVAVLPVPLN